MIYRYEKIDINTRKSFRIFIIDFLIFINNLHYKILGSHFIISIIILVFINHFLVFIKHYFVFINHFLVFANA